MLFRTVNRANEPQKLAEKGIKMIIVSAARVRKAETLLEVAPSRAK